MAEPIPLVVPQMGVVEEIIVIEWLVEEGAAVAAGQAVVSIETAKAEVVLEAPADGTIAIVVDVSDVEVPVGSTLAYVAP